MLLKNMKKYLLIILVSIVLVSCTAQTFIPIRPLNSGENEIRFSFNYSLNKFDLGSFQLSAFHGISDKDVIGTSFANFLIPNNFSYAHYWGNKNSFSNVQFHLNDIFSLGYNPPYELDFGYSIINNKSMNSFKIGLGYYNLSPLEIAFGKSLSKTNISPIIGYRFQQNQFSIDAQFIYGMTDYFIDYYKNVGTNFSYITNNFKDRNLPQKLLRSEVKNIFEKEGEYSIVLENQDTLLLVNRDPYADCFKCDTEKRSKEAYLSSDEHKVYWMYYSEWFNQTSYPTLIELNMKKILNDFNSGKDLNLVEDKNLTKMTQLKNSSILHDIFFSIGWTTNK